MSDCKAPTSSTANVRFKAFAGSRRLRHIPMTERATRAEGSVSKPSVVLEGYVTSRRKKKEDDSVSIKF